MIFCTDMDELQVICPKAARFWASHDMASLECGRYDLDDEEYVNVSAYTSAPREEKQYESHLAYLDIQCVIAGQELIEVAPISTLNVSRAFSSKADYALYANDVAGEAFLMKPGRFVVVGPEDAHMPGVAIGAPAQIKKAVFKIKVQ